MFSQERFFSPTDLFVVRRVDEDSVCCTDWAARIGPWRIIKFVRTEYYFQKDTHLVGCSLIVGGRDEPISIN